MSLTMPGKPHGDISANEGVDGGPPPTWDPGKTTQPQVVNSLVWMSSETAYMNEVDRKAGHRLVHAYRQGDRICDPILGALDGEQVDPAERDDLCPHCLELAPDYKP